MLQSLHNSDITDTHAYDAHLDHYLNIAQMKCEFSPSHLFHIRIDYLTVLSEKHVHASLALRLYQQRRCRNSSKN